MNRTRMLVAALGTALVGAAAMFSTAASAGGNVGWSVSIGAPGFAVTAGQPAYYGAPYRPYYRLRTIVRRPSCTGPYYAPVSRVRAASGGLRAARGRRAAPVLRPAVRRRAGAVLSTAS